MVRKIKDKIRHQHPTKVQAVVISIMGTEAEAEVVTGEATGEVSTVAEEVIGVAAVEDTIGRTITGIIGTGVIGETRNPGGI